MKELPAGMAVRVEHNAQIVGLADKDNPYWYEIEYPTGEHDVVNISRLHWYADDVRASVDIDGSIQIISNKLTAQGAINLYHFLRTHYADFEAVASTSDGSMISGNEPFAGSTT